MGKYISHCVYLGVEHILRVIWILGELFTSVTCRVPVSSIRTGVASNQVGILLTLGRVKIIPYPAVTRIGLGDNHHMQVTQMNVQL